MIKMLLETLNAYAELYRQGNNNVVGAIGRIIEKLEKETGKKVKVEVIKGKAQYTI